MCQQGEARADTAILSHKLGKNDGIKPTGHASHHDGGGQNGVGNQTRKLNQQAKSQHKCWQDQ